MKNKILASVSMRAFLKWFAKVFLAPPTGGALQHIATLPLFWVTLKNHNENDNIGSVRHHDHDNDNDYNGRVRHHDDDHDDDNILDMAH